VKSILFVEDETANRQLYEEEFNEEPYRIFWAVDGIEALKILSEETIDLVVTDIRMPNMNGISLIAQMLLERKNIPVVVVTGYNHYRDWMTVNEFNVKAFFVKPVTMQLLKFTVADLLKASERT